MSRWVCPFCNHPQIYSKDNSGSSSELLWVGAPRSSLTTLSHAFRCLNDGCDKVTIYFSAYQYDGSKHANRGDLLGIWRLWPESASKPQPDYIPLALRTDYGEACLIRDKSPKAPATLARRCLQGMIHDFCNIDKGNLGREIEALRKLLEEGSAPTGVSIESVDGIDAVRSIGNIGAHMEKDIDVIIDVDPGEAQVLIELIETLFDEWYIARHVRSKRFEKVKAIAAEKKGLITESKKLSLPSPE